MLILGFISDFIQNRIFDRTFMINGNSHCRYLLYGNPLAGQGGCLSVERIDLLRKDFRSEIFRFRARRSKNYEAYTPYMLNNFCEVVAEIWKLQPKNLYAVGLIYAYGIAFIELLNQANISVLKTSH